MHHISLPRLKTKDKISLTFKRFLRAKPHKQQTQHVR